MATEEPVHLSTKRFAVYAWLVLVFHLAVIVWGAYVRATGSGAGCGGHWPLCNGEILPQQPQVSTLIEFTHRISSGMAVILVLGLVFFAFRVFPARHPVRRFAGLSLLLVLTEALLGAALVLLGLVAQNASAARGLTLSIHLVNTLLLLASLALTAWLASRRPAAPPGPEAAPYYTYAGAILGTILLGITGAIAALGDTLFAATSLEAGIRQDFSSSASLFLRLRIIHPILAVAVGLFLLAVAVHAGSGGTQIVKSLARRLMLLTIVQLLVGMLNLWLMAPVWLQMFHLLVADLVWITLVVLATEALGLWQPAHGVLPVRSEAPEGRLIAQP